MIIVGAIVYIDLGIKGIDFAEHTAVYLGNNRFVELNGDGHIRMIDSWTLLNSSKQRTGNRIFIATDGMGYPLQNHQVALRAIKEVNNYWTYHLLENNCHEFVSGCILNQFENDYNFFYQVKELLSQQLNQGYTVKWRPFKVTKKSPEEELWVNDFFSAFQLFLKLAHVEQKDNIQKTLKLSRLSQVLKEAPSNQQGFLNVYKELLKQAWKTRHQKDQSLLNSKK